MPLGAAVTLLPTPRTNDARGAGEHGTGGLDLRTTVALLPTPTATPYGNNQSQSDGAAVRPSLDSLAGSLLLPTPTAKDADGSRNATAQRRSPKPTTATAGWTLSDVTHADRWGQYASAIVRWESVLGRPAPDPTETGSKGQPRLSPRFVEWLMGAPDGHVTSLLGRNAALRVLGNGVVRQQAAHALSLLLATAASERAG
jgi:DNA (cytosine-5)-methyltransferase 1